MAGEPITVAGGDALTLDYLDLGDAIGATIAAAESALRAEIVNIGPGEGVTLRDIVKLIRIHAGIGKVRVVEQLEEAGAGIRHEYQFGPEKLWLDAGKAQRLLGWRPGKRMNETVRETVSAIQRVGAPQD